MSLSVVVLAAGQGVRMHSDLPKVLHSIGGRSILERIIQKVSQIEHEQAIIVFGYKGELLKEALAAYPQLLWAEQAERLGTGHATLQALNVMASVDSVLILNGDIPFVSTGTLNRLIHETPEDAIGLIAATVADPKGLGRIVRDATGNFIEIVEEKDATLDQKKIVEINAGIYLVPKKYLDKWLPEIKSHNAQNEYYLPDILPFAKSAGVSIITVSAASEGEVMGVNDKMQLATLERHFQATEAKRLMEQGVTLADPARFDLRGDLIVGKDVCIDINVILEGEVTLGNNVQLGPNVFIKDAVLGNDVQILANSVIEGATLGDGAVVGPFARVRPGTVLGPAAKIGNFVEIKNATIGDLSKINHLSYIGDATIGESVNIGAGTITCNFDGKKKHRTLIEKGASIGAHTQLIAPVSVGENATVGAGTTVTRDVPANALVHNRFELRCIDNWVKIKEE